MMIKQKSTSILILSIVFTLIVSCVVWATPQNTESEYKIVLQRDEISDLDQLYNMAKEGETWLEMPLLPAEITNSNEEVFTVPTYSTTQLLKIEENSDGAKKETYVTSYFADVALNRIGLPREKWDGSLSVKAYSSVYYSIVSSGGIDYYDLSSVSGGWYIADGTVSLSNRHVIISNQGYILGGGLSNTVLDKYPTSNSFSYTCPSSWPSVAATSNYFPGCSTLVTLTRGGSTWNLTLNNNLPATM